METAPSSLPSPPHRVLRLWVRTRTEGPLEERRELSLVAGKGVEGDHAFGRMRHVVIVFEDDWRAATRDLGRDVDPSARRGQVLVTGGGCAALVGRTIRLGGAIVEVKGTVAPCPVMEAAAPGLQAVLEPDGRAGVWGRVLEGTTLRPGDVLEVATPAAKSPS